MPQVSLALHRERERPSERLAEHRHRRHKEAPSPADPPPSKGTSEGSFVDAAYGNRPKTTKTLLVPNMTQTSTETGIRCANCGSFDNKVLRTTASAGYIVRRRECLACRARITTSERELHTPPATGSGLVQLSIGQIRASLDLLADLASGTSAEAQN